LAVVPIVLLGVRIDYFAADLAPHRMTVALRAVFPVSMSVLTDAIPGVKASHAIGLAYGIAGLGDAAGPLIAGLLTDTVVRR
jgi:MFS family permease